MFSFHCLSVFIILFPRLHQWTYWIKTSQKSWVISFLVFSQKIIIVNRIEKPKIVFRYNRADQGLKTFATRATYLTLHFNISFLSESKRSWEYLEFCTIETNNFSRIHCRSFRALSFKSFDNKGGWCKSTQKLSSTGHVSLMKWLSISVTACHSNDRGVIFIMLVIAFMTVWAATSQYPDLWLHQATTTGPLRLLKKWINSMRSEIKTVIRPFTRTIWESIQGIEFYSDRWITVTV